MDAQFPPVANWTTNAEQQIGAGVGTVSTNFSDGATLAQWLQNSGATVPGTANQIDISTLRTDVSTVDCADAVVAGLNSGSYAGQTGNPVMQMTFNAPVGAPAAQPMRTRDVQRLPRDYATWAAARSIPPSALRTSKMSAQEEMLEYALFDLVDICAAGGGADDFNGLQSEPADCEAGDTGRPGDSERNQHEHYDGRSGVRRS